MGVTEMGMQTENRGAYNWSLGRDPDQETHTRHLRGQYKRH